MIFKQMLQITNYILLLLGFAACYAQDDPEVDTTYGVVRGRAIPLSSGVVVNSYMGVPYAKAPIGNLRFEAPEPPDSWSTPFEAFEPGNACVQSTNFSVTFTHPGWSRYSEDCLHANIYSPQGYSDLPVMVFIHGGGFQEGANFQSPGYFMAEKNVVFVSLNYRLGILGFAYTGDDAVPGNMGLLDLIQGLTFIQENIAAFGGDPTRVTISGESAGGVLVGLLMMSPLAAGLFHGAIPQSGNDLLTWGYLPPETNPEKHLLSVAEQFDCPTDSGEAIINCLRTVDAEDLVQAPFNCTLGYFCFGFQPVVDGVILPDTPNNIRDSGNYNKVPEIIGITEDENLMLLFYPNISQGLDREDFDTLLYSAILYSLQKYPTLDHMEEIYQAFRFYYADWPYFDDPVSNRDMMSKLLTDIFFAYETDLQAKWHSNDGLDVYFYVFNYRTSYAITSEWMGAVHGSELSLQFGWPFLVENDEAFEHSQINPFTRAANSTHLDREMSSFFMTLWTNFVSTGHPTPKPVPGPNNSSTTWPKFVSSEVELNYLQFQDTPEILRDYKQKDFAFWTEYMEYFLYGNPDGL